MPRFIGTLPVFSSSSSWNEAFRAHRDSQQLFPESTPFFLRSYHASTDDRRRRQSSRRSKEYDRESVPTTGVVSWLEFRPLLRLYHRWQIYRDIHSRHDIALHSLNPLCRPRCIWPPLVSPRVRCESDRPRIQRQHWDHHCLASVDCEGTQFVEAAWLTT